MTDYITLFILAMETSCIVFSLRFEFSCYMHTQLSNGANFEEAYMTMVAEPSLQCPCTDHAVSMQCPCSVHAVSMH
jgi:hypothetical protein